MLEQYKMTNAADQERIEIMQFIIENIPMGILMIKGDGTIVYASRPMRENFGYFWRTDLEGQNVSMLLHEDIRTHHTEVLIRSFFSKPSAGAMKARIIQGQKKNGESVNIIIWLIPKARKVPMSFDVENEEKYGIACVFFVGEFGFDLRSFFNQNKSDS